MRAAIPERAVRRHGGLRRSRCASIRATRAGGCCCDGYRMLTVVPLAHCVVGGHRQRFRTGLYNAAVLDSDCLAMTSQATARASLRALGCARNSTTVTKATPAAAARTPPAEVWGAR